MCRSSSLRSADSDQSPALSRAPSFVVDSLWLCGSQVRCPRVRRLRERVVGAVMRGQHHPVGAEQGRAVAQPRGEGSGCVDGEGLARGPNAAGFAAGGSTVTIRAASAWARRLSVGVGVRQVRRAKPSPRRSSRRTGRLSRVRIGGWGLSSPGRGPRPGSRARLWPPPVRAPPRRAGLSVVRAACVSSPVCLPTASPTRRETRATGCALVIARPTRTAVRTRWIAWGRRSLS